MRMPRPNALVLVVLVGLLGPATLAACRDEPEKTDKAPPNPSVLVLPVPKASASAPFTALATMAGFDAGAAGDGGSAAPVGIDAGATPIAAGVKGDAGAGPCGEKGQPDCPLQEWMKRVVNKPYLAKDAPAVAEAFDKMVPLAPPGGGYPNWVSISKDGAKAARAADLEAAKAACRGCHDQYKKKYRAELRTRPL